MMLSSVQSTLERQNNRNDLLCCLFIYCLRDEEKNEHIHLNYTWDVAVFVQPSEFNARRISIIEIIRIRLDVHMEFYCVFHLKTTCPKVKAD